LENNVIGDAGTILAEYVAEKNRQLDAVAGSAIIEGKFSETIDEFAKRVV
jgi:hypothetical protein